MYFPMAVSSLTFCAPLTGQEIFHKLVILNLKFLSLCVGVNSSEEQLSEVHLKIQDTTN